MCVCVCVTAQGRRCVPGRFSSPGVQQFQQKLQHLCWPNAMLAALHQTQTCEQASPLPASLALMIRWTQSINLGMPRGLCAFPWEVNALLVAAFSLQYCHCASTKLFPGSRITPGSVTHRHTWMETLSPTPAHRDTHKCIPDWLYCKPLLWICFLRAWSVVAQVLGMI